MNLLSGVVFVGLVLLVGWAVLWALGRRGFGGWVELISLSLTAGMGAVGYLLFLASLAGSPPRRWMLAGLAMLAAITVFAMRRRVSIDQRRLCARDLFTALPAALAMFALAGVFVDALKLPVYEGDAFAIWVYRAKVVFARPLIPTPPEFSTVELSGGHTRYPLLVPFMVASALTVYGNTADAPAAKLIFPLGQLALAGLVYAFARRRLPRFQSMSLVAILLALPAMTLWGGSGYADGMLALFHVASVIALLDWVENDRPSDLILAGLLTAFAGLTKNEGLALVVGNGLVVAWKCVKSKTDRRVLLAVMLGVLAMLAPFYAWSPRVPVADENYPGHLSPGRIVSCIPKLRMIAIDFAREMFRPGAQGPLWIVLIAAGVLGWRAFEKPGVRWLWFLLGFQATAYMVTIAVSPWDTASLLGATSDRLVMQITPMAALLIAAHGAIVMKPTDCPA